MRLDEPTCLDESRKLYEFWDDISITGMNKQLTFISNLKIVSIFGIFVLLWTREADPPITCEILLTHDKPIPKF